MANKEDSEEPEIDNLQMIQPWMKRLHIPD